MSWAKQAARMLPASLRWLETAFGEIKITADEEDVWCNGDFGPASTCDRKTAPGKVAMKFGQGSSILPNAHARLSGRHTPGRATTAPPKWLIKTDYHSWRI